MKLSKVVKNGEEEITEITLREPTGDEVIEFGLPFLIIPSDDDSAIDIRMKVVKKYIVTLGGFPPSVVGKLSPKDLTDLMGEVLGFFGK
jgi:hypothetical protein